MTQNVNAQDDSAYTYGEAIYLDAGMFGSVYFPYMKLVFYDDRDTTYHMDLLFVALVTSDTYHSFPDNSRLLIKFQDDEVFELESFSDVVKAHYNLGWNSTLKKYVEMYHTGRHYKITADALNKLLTEKIAKIRIELSNGTYKNIVLEDKLAKKILPKLVNSFKSISTIQQKRLQNLNDIHNNF